MRAKHLIASGALVGAIGIAGILLTPSADACEYNFPTAQGALGTTFTIVGTANPGTTCGASVTLSGLTSAGAPLTLFNKVTTNDPTETGIGLTNDPSGQNEVTIGSFIQIAYSSNAIQPLSIQAQSVQTGEQWRLAGALIGGTDVIAPTASTALTSFSSASPFFGFTAVNAGSAAANVLLAHLDSVNSPTTQTPEPASLALLGAALVGFGLIRRRKS